MSALTTETYSAPSLELNGVPELDGAVQLGSAGKAIRTRTQVSFASVHPVKQFVAVVGPPAVGKSTVTRALADRFGARVFRLREFAAEFRSQPGVDQRPFDTCDRLGWLPEETVFRLLRAAFLDGQFPARDLMILENFPGSLTQLLLVKATSEQLQAPLIVIELIAADSVLVGRVRTRLVCLTCEPDPRDDPHRPAHPAAHDASRCDGCGAKLLPRRGDEPQRFAARLARFRRRIPAIRRAATALYLPYHAVDATGDPDTCLQGVTRRLPPPNQ